MEAAKDEGQPGSSSVVQVLLAALSSGVADAIEYCTQDLKMQQFRGSEATVKFIKHTTTLLG